MDRKIFLSWINYIENKYPVDEWQVYGMDLWPYLRMKLLHRHLSENNQEDKSIRSNVSEGKFSFFKKISKIVNSIFYLFRIKKAEYVFLGASSHRVIHERSWFNRFFDPVIANLENNGHKCILFEYGTSSVDTTEIFIHKSENVFFVEKLIYPFIVYFYNFHKKPKYQKLNSRFSEFLKELNSLNYQGVYINESSIRREVFSSLYKMYIYKYFFRCYFRYSKPKALVTLCYYSATSYSAIAAANSMNISSVDLQHGPQTGIHLAYSNFQKVPKFGFNILPKVFWVWDDFSKTGLKQWIIQQNTHTVEKWGHPWVQYWLQKGLTSKKKAKPQILLSLQPLKTPIPDFVLSAINKTANEYTWIIRLHPRQLNQKNKLHKLLIDKCMHHSLCLDDGISTPLPQVLMNTDIHITCFSGTALEASMFKVPTVFIDPIAKEGFSGMIQKGEAYMLNKFNEESLMNTMKQLIYSNKNFFSQKNMFVYDYSKIFNERFK